MWRLVSVVVEQNGIEKVLNGSHVLVATGRNPNTERLGLELNQRELTDRGYIKVKSAADDRAGVWAIGEVAGSRSSRTSCMSTIPRSHANLTGGNRVTRAGSSHIVCLPTSELLVSA